MNISSPKAFTLVEILIALAIIAVILAVAVPNFVRSREESHKNGCIANLKQINSAIDQWVIEERVRTGTVPSESEEEDIYFYIKGARPHCPGGGTYTIHEIGAQEQVTCSLADKRHRL
jgi:prepilin-type N-terminal cleavage/methylation domain-containing protein